MVHKMIGLIYLRIKSLDLTKYTSKAIIVDYPAWYLNMIDLFLVVSIITVYVTYVGKTDLTKIDNQSMAILILLIEYYHLFVCLII